MEAKFLITNYNSKPTSFLLEDGRLVRACPLYNASIIGNVYTARVVNVVKNINAAFLDAGTGDYLYYSLEDNNGRNIFLKHGNTNKVCIGDELLVQVSKDPIKTKKGEATSNITLRGDYVIINRSSDVGISSKITDAEVREELKAAVTKVLKEYESEGSSGRADSLQAGAIVRTSAKDVPLDTVLKEAETTLCKLNDMIEKAGHSTAKTLIMRAEDDYLQQIKEIIVKDKYNKFEVITDIEEIFDEINNLIKDADFLGTYNPEHEISVRLFSDNMTDPTNVFNLKSLLEKGMARTIHLKSGGSVIVDSAEAMTVIDVNTGKAIKGSNSEKTFLKINMEAAETISRILRLRNISGIIIIDFINLKDPEDIRQMIEHLKMHLKKDEVRVTYVDMTGLGLVELTRQKRSSPLTLYDFE
ncbi:MAG: ribonuclease E/G [Eubacterium sp.]|nr:ribonuclease E/G [Eubacterium sp.]